MTWLERTELMEAIAAAGLTGKVIPTPLIECDCDEAGLWYTVINGVGIPNHDGTDMDRMAMQAVTIEEALYKDVR